MASVATSVNFKTGLAELKMSSYHLFICYSNYDRDFVKALLVDLERFDVKGFLDREDIGSGAKWTNQITKAILESDALVVILSESAMRSNWVMAELGQALSLNKQIIPVLSPSTNIEFDVPDFLKGRIIIDARKMSTLEASAAIVAAVRSTSRQTELERLLKERTKRRVVIFTLIGSLLTLILFLILRSVVQVIWG